MSANTEYFVLTLPLQTEIWQENQLNKRFEVNRRIYNALLNSGWKRYKQMYQTKRYRNLLRKLEETQEKSVRKDIYRELDKMVEEYRLRRYDFTKDAAQYRQYFAENTDAPVIQNLAVHAWKAVAAVIRQQGQQVRMKKPDTLMSLEGKTNATSIRYKDGLVLWKGLKLPVLQKRNSYEEQALQQQIRYCRIKWKWIRGKKKFYVDLILKGQCPKKQWILENESASEGNVGIDIGFQKLVCVGETQIFERKLPVRSNAAEAKKKVLAKRMERSRRAMNPENYDEFGRVVPNSVFWKTSINYRKYKSQYREIMRRQIAIREEEQHRLLKEMMLLGTRFYVERLDYAGMKQKYFGKKLEQLALASFLKKAEWKFGQYGRQLIFVNPVEAAAGNLNHLTGEIEKPKNRSDYRSIDGTLVERQIYSAFLLKNINEQTGRIHLEQCRETYDDFLELYKEYLGEEIAS